MASIEPGIKFCANCPDRRYPQCADVYCVNCQIFICLPCLGNHELKYSDHKFITTENDCETATDQIPKNSWDVRNIKGSFCDIIHRLKHVKTVENISDLQIKFGTVNGYFWRRYGDDESGKIAVYDTDINKVTEFNWKEIKDAACAQQVSLNDVMILTGDGLHVVDTEGKYQYKIMDGFFSDISIGNSGEVAVVDCEESKVIFLEKKSDKWQRHRDISFDSQTEAFHSLLLGPEDAVFVATSDLHTILKVNKQTGEILQKYGSGTESSQLGEFHGPLVSAVDRFDCVIVSDYGNGRFQVLYPDGRWEEIKVDGSSWVTDVIVLGDFVYVLCLEPEHDDISINCKILKFLIS